MMQSVPHHLWWVCFCLSAEGNCYRNSSADLFRPDSDVYYSFLCSILLTYGLPEIEMKMSASTFRKAVSIALVFSIFLTFLIVTTGCPPAAQTPDNGTEVTNGNGEQEQAAFSWDTQRRVPRWRLGSPITWIKSDTDDEAIAQSESSGKPILLYISNYESDLTRTIEEGLFSNEVYIDKIRNNFIAWELDWWEAPSLAQIFLGKNPAPAVFVVLPGTNPTSGDKGCMVLDFWVGSDILSWPLHGQENPSENPDSDARIAEFKTALTNPAGIETSAVDEIPYDAEMDPDAYVETMFESIRQELLNGEDLYPEEALWLAYRLGYDEESSQKIADVVATWKSRINALGNDIVWMPDSIFVEGSGPAVDVERNLTAFLAASAINKQYPVNPFRLTDSLKFMITSESGVYAGGFPPYLDIRSVLEGNSEYIGDDADLSGLDFVEGRLLNPTMGPRDIAWVNAHVMSSLLEIVMASPDIMDMTTASGTKVSEFIVPVSKAMLDAVALKAGEPASMTLEERIYIIDLMNRVYQLTASSEIIYKAEDIAKALVEDEFGDEEVGKMVPLYPDMAITLHNFGWLMELEDYKKAAREISEEGVRYSSGYDYIEQVRMAYAYDVVHSTTVHTTVISAADDPVGLELLKIGLEKWDPGKVSQIVTPGEVDAKLLERKGYADMGQAAAFVCIDSMCKMPAFDGESLRKTLLEVYTEIHEPEKE